MPARTIIITGASSGIGLAAARLLAARGDRTILIARRAVLLDRLATELSARATSTSFPLDLADTAAIAPAIAGLLSREQAAGHPPPTALINCAGFGVYAPFAQQSPADLERLWRVNTAAPAELTRALLPTFLAARPASPAPGAIRAHVVNVCSMAARLGPWGHAGYAASKGALRAHTESLAAEYHPQGVRFTLVYPGIIATPYFSLAPMARVWPRVAPRAIPPEPVARAMVKALWSRRLSVYSPGFYRILDAINLLAPGLALRLVRGGSLPPTPDQEAHATAPPAAPAS